MPLRQLDPLSDAGAARLRAALGYRAGYVPRSYPLAGTPPQFVYSTLMLMPASYVGAGDVVRGSIDINPRPTMIPQSYILNGMPRIAGAPVQQPLTYQPYNTNPLSYMYPNYGV